VGIVSGLGLLTRSNGIVLALLVLAPFLTTMRWRSRVADSAFAIAGLCVPICLWIWVASVTGSPVTPTHNHANLAYAYAEGRISGDIALLMADRFTSTWQVIAHDPGRITVTYLKNLVRLPMRIVTQTAWFPVAILGAAALPLWLLRIADPRVVIVLTTALGGALLTNMHPVFEARYYLFLVPLLGASAGYAISLWLDRPSRLRLAPAATITAVAAVAVVGLLSAAPRARAKAEAPDVRAQLAEALSAVKRHTPAEAVLVTYKENLAFHARRQSALLPSVTTIEQLCGPLQRQLSSGPAYVYIGYAERRRSRIEISRLLLGDDLPAWLVVTDEGKAGGGWRLLAVKPTACGGATLLPGRSRSAASSRETVAWRYSG
jgi:hypothetical protein